MENLLDKHMKKLFEMINNKIDTSYGLQHFDIECDGIEYSVMSAENVELQVFINNDRVIKLNRYNSDYDYINKQYILNTLRKLKLNKIKT